MEKWTNDELRERGLFLCDALPTLSLDETLRAAHIMARSLLLAPGQEVEDIITAEQFARLVMPQLASTSAASDDRRVLEFQTAVALIKLQRENPELFTDPPKWRAIARLMPEWLLRYAAAQTFKLMMSN
jgi:hypothetical protein